MSDFAFWNHAVEAAKYFAMGWKPIPLCWPDPSGMCACGRRCLSPGKTPLVKISGVEVDQNDVSYWWSRWPYAGIGCLLEPSGLVLIDLDGEEALYEALSNGLPHTYRVKTTKGWHYYYKRQEDFPVGRRTRTGQSKSIDILSTGISVLPPTVHKSRKRYRQNGSVPAVLPDAPWWASGGRVSRFTKRVLPSFALSEEDVRKARELNHQTPIEQIQEALQFVPEEDYTVWLKVGFALKNWDEEVGGSEGFRLWDAWSSKGQSYPGSAELAKKWSTFKRHDVTLGTLFDLAKGNGYSLASKKNGEWTKRYL